ncbi:hypothetical protein PLEOSDRAFT_1114213 [Pleurotus ostreatus PC15]|uniref:DUF7598 domain-containing protein n=2 Tax=Pleurotus TaxID=5320 RepID=A0A067N7N8_PLEO1|nr:hypothetical protein CCMSSC00406_0005280 [Pleurotus cornucopiae]KDQ24053.1 hypothetical protein PLEOSDRAFT_1114213 [Pleurotus ostreatus PC15]
MLPPRAYAFIGLNVVRILSIIALLLVFASSIAVMVHDVEAVNNFTSAGKGPSATSNSTMDAIMKADYIEGSTVPNQAAGAFWAVLNRLLIIFQTIILILSELGWPSSFFDRYFPVLGKDFGVGALGTIQCLIGAAVLSHFVDDFALVAAFFLFSIGCLNIVVGLIFRQGAKSKRSVTSWREKRKNLLLPTTAKIGPVSVDLKPAVSNAASFANGIFSGEKKGMSRADTLGFGRQGEKAAALKGYMISKPVESLPRYAPGPPQHTGGTSVTFVDNTEYSSTKTITQ